MSFKKFIIYVKDETREINEERSMLINLDHIVSIKEIKIMANDRRVINGHWIRLSNGKKYKAVSIPEELRLGFKEEITPINFEGEENSLNNIQ